MRSVVSAHCTIGRHSAALLHQSAQVKVLVTSAMNVVPPYYLLLLSRLLTVYIISSISSTVALSLQLRQLHQQDTATTLTAPYAQCLLPTVYGRCRIRLAWNWPVVTRAVLQTKPWL